jgi:hypothetical protein
MGATVTQDTPMQISVLRYSSGESSTMYVEPAFVEAATELRNKFVLVAPDNFLAEYLPQHPRDMPTIDHETFMNVAFNRSTEEATANGQPWIEKIDKKDPIY